MQLALQDFTALVRLQAASVAGAARTLLDLSVGSVLRALLEANASVGLWVQWLIMEVLATTRAATSGGADLDSWVQDFGLSRLPAVSATGQARFSRVTAGIAAVIPVGAAVRTGSSTDAQAFLVVADAGRAEWNGGGYVIGATATAIVVPIRANVAGRAGNVQAGVLQLLSTAIPGVDAVTNDDPAAGGLDAETDTALRTRFSGYIDSRTRATEQAVTFAIQSVRQGLQFSILERTDAGGAVRAGHFTVVLDDGSGSPTAAVIGAVGAAIEAVRPLGGTFGVQAPVLVSAAITITVQGPADALAAVQAAVGAMVGGLGIGAPLAVSRIVQVTHEADSRIASVSSVVVNGGGGDLVINGLQRVVAGPITVQL